MLKRIKQSIQINASKERVWDVLTNDEYTRKWYGTFSEGSYAQTDWQEGSKAIFVDKSNSGMIAEITVNKYAEQISMKFLGAVNNGKEDYESKTAKSVQGGEEHYFLQEKDNITTISVETDMDEKYFDLMNNAWKNALVQLKELAEK